MAELITKITKEEAKLTAKLHIASLFLLSDGFFTDGRATDEVEKKVGTELNLIMAKFIKGLELDDLPNHSGDCIVRAKEIIKNKV